MTASLKFPYKIERGTEFSEKWKHIQSVKVKTNTGIIRAAPFYPTIAEEVYNFKVRPDDVWVVTHPRSGTTLTQEMVWLIVNDDYETARKIPLLKRFPYLEAYSHGLHDPVEQIKKTIKDEDELKEFLEIMGPQWITLERSTNRRFIKSHLQFPLLPPDLLTSGCKIIYVARNPKDAALSLFRYRGIDVTKEDFPEFWNLFQNGCIENGPYWDHVKQGWSLRGNANFCFLFYEDIVKDRRSAIKTLAEFLEKTLSEEQVEKLADHLKVENFRKNESINREYAYYMRKLEGDGIKPIGKGVVGDWKNYFTDELNARANEWIEENYKGTDLRFPIDIK